MSSKDLTDDMANNYTPSEADMKKIHLQSPFRETKLLSAMWFQSYCRDNGANLFSGDLERLHKKGLLYPAVKVYRGACEMRRIYAKFNGSKNYEWRYVEPDDIEKFHPKKVINRSYHMSGGFHITTGWLEYYKTNEMVEYPAGQKFTPWDKTLYEDFTQDRRLLEKQHELFYEPLQLISLKVILKETHIWRFMDKEQVKKEKKRLKKYLSEINQFLAFYIEAEKIVLEEKLERNKFAETCAAEGDARQEIVNKLRQEDAFIISPLKKNARQLLDNHKIDVDYIERWQTIIARFSVIGESKRSFKHRGLYLKMMDETSLIQAEDVNWMIYVLNRFSFFISGKQKMVKQVLEYSDSPQCTVCGNYFSSKRQGQKTCGKKECIREHKNALKRKRGRK